MSAESTWAVSLIRYQDSSAEMPRITNTSRAVGTSTPNQCCSVPWVKYAVGPMIAAQNTA